MPKPCRGCGVGLMYVYRLCAPCGGNVLKQRLFRKRKKAQETLLELKETQQLEK